MKKIVSMTNIHKHYNNQQVQTLALQGVNMDIFEGEFVSISGPSGCGKSTLLAIMGLMDTPSEGQYQIADTDTTNLSIDQRTHIRNLHIGYVFQSFNLIDNLSVYANVALPLEHRGMGAANIREKVEKVLKQVDMLHKKDYRPNQLSGGQQQRIAIARALVGEPDLILVDEPTGNLDSKNGDQVMSLLEQLNKDGATIVMVTHDSRYARCASRQIQILDGQIVTEQQLNDSNAANETLKGAA